MTVPTTRLQQVFGKPRVLLPVIHHASREAALASVDVAVTHGADGVWLINQGVEADALPALAAAVAARHPRLWLGVNMLGREPDVVFASLRPFTLAGAEVRGVWADDAGLAFGLPRAPDLLTAAAFAERAREARAMALGPLYFGGVAFKGQAPVADRDLPRLGSYAQWRMDVVTTSGRATGSAADPARVAALAWKVSPPAAVGLASGVTPENVGDYLPHAHAFLVASGIESAWGVLDPARVRALADAVERGPR